MIERRIEIEKFIEIKADAEGVIRRQSVASHSLVSFVNENKYIFYMTKFFSHLLLSAYIFIACIIF